MLDYLRETLSRGGPIMICIYFLSLYAWFLIIRKYGFLKGELEKGEDFIADIAKRLKKTDCKSVLDTLRDDNRKLSASMHTILSADTLEVKKVSASTEQIGYYQALDRHMGTLATLGALAPLLGLLGTVTGMMKTFSIIRLFGSANPAIMADGISEALLTTQAGLVTAFPIILARSFLLNKIRAGKDNFEKLTQSAGVTDHVSPY